MSNTEDSELLPSKSKNVAYMGAAPAQSETFLKPLIAFANGDGGQLVFGIEDGTHRIIGLKNEILFKTMDTISSAIADNCEPHLSPTLWLKDFGDDKTILIVSVPRGEQKPYYLKSKGLIEGTYCHVNGTTHLVDNCQLKELILEGSRQSYDQQLCTYLEVAEDGIESLCESLYQKALKNTLDETAKKALRRPTKKLLLSWGVLKEAKGRIIPTVAYALLTGQLQDQPCIQCAVFKGTTRAKFLDHRDIQGPVQDQVDGAILYVEEKLNWDNAANRYELPIDSIRELIASAVACRSYLDPGLIQIALYDDRLEITTPGLLPPGITPQKLKDGCSKIRNRALAEAFAYMRLSTPWESGVPRCLKECKAYGLPSPQLIDFDADLRINVFRNPSHPNPPLQNRLQCRPVLKQNCLRAL